MNGDIGMSSHEKEKEQEDTYTKRVRKSFITPSLHLCFFEDLNPFYVGISVRVFFLYCVFSLHIITIIKQPF